MFTYLNPLAFRLPENEREKFLKKHKTTLFEAYGAVMEEYVTVPDNLFGKIPRPCNNIFSGAMSTSKH
jgi:hypothetical protein